MIAMQELMEKLQEKVMLYKRQAEESEEASAQNLAKYRKLKREYDEAEERAENAETVVSTMRSRGGSVFGNRALSPTSWNAQPEYMAQSMANETRAGSQGGVLFSDEEADSGVSGGASSRRTRRRVQRANQQDTIGGDDTGLDSDYAVSSPRYGSKGRGSNESTPVMSPHSRLSPESGAPSEGPKEGGWRQNFPLSLDDVKIPEGREDLAPSTRPSKRSPPGDEREKTPSGNVKQDQSSMIPKLGADFD